MSYGGLFRAGGHRRCFAFAKGALQRSPSGYRRFSELGPHFIFTARSPWIHVNTDFYKGKSPAGSFCPSCLQYVVRCLSWADCITDYDHSAV